VLPALCARDPGRVRRRASSCADHVRWRAARGSRGPQRQAVGPAGGVLDGALRQSGLERSQSYVTNVVKHFKWEPQGKRRLHKHPSRYEIEQCRWWLDKEMLAVDPKLVVAPGAFAACALMKRPVVRERGKLLQWADGRNGLATIHPAAVLRAHDGEAREQMLQEFIARISGSRLRWRRSAQRLPLVPRSPSKRGSPFFRNTFGAPIVALPGTCNGNIPPNKKLSQSMFPIPSIVASAGRLQPLSTSAARGLATCRSARVRK
jgi:uracil-DNA glycosylase family 4